MEEINTSAIKNKIIGGVIALTLRTLILQGISALSIIILYSLLSPEVFGIFFIASALIAFCGNFSDVGLAAALIQKKENPTDQDFNTVFFIQLMLVGTISLVGILLSPQLGKVYKLDGNGIFLIQTLLISFFLSSLKTIPSVILERKLEFNLLVIPQIVETVTYYAIAIILAKMQFGVASFSWAALARGIIGLITIFIISPWRISFSFSKQAAKRLLSFGIPFQGNSILALIKDNLITLFLGMMLSKRELGYINWAKTSAEMHLRLIMDNVIRVTFPAYARLQEEKEILRKAIEKSILFLALFIFPATAVLILYIKPLLFIIPRFLKWQPGLFSFYLFTLASVGAAFSTPLVNALNSLGEVKVTLKLMLFWTVVTWVLIPPLVFLYGFNGFAIGTIIISLTSLIPIFLLKKKINFSVIPNMRKPLIITILMVIPLVILLKINSSLVGVIFSAAVGAVIYITFTWFWLKTEIQPYLPNFLKIKS